MEKDIKISFHNYGFRSFITINLCQECPRQDNKGCCGLYSPVFYPMDFAYWLEKNPELINFILNLPNITILDSSITVNSPRDGDSYRCPMHNFESGCLLAQKLRESICRHFVCPGVYWQDELKLSRWKDFFEQIFDYEITINNTIDARMRLENLSLRVPEQRNDCFEFMKKMVLELTASMENVFTALPQQEEFWIKRELVFGKQWLL
ncbi:MAG: hypothetical protein LBK69_06055 [Syntrophomonadaceae bacterium]|jgi:hypothetical protein|nr:hypothetical protein [Syntrophomonadaceae bacterium]